MAYIQFIVWWFFSEFLFLVCSIPVLALLVFVSAPWSRVLVVHVTRIILALIWLVGGSWIVHDITRRLVFKNERFGEAVGSAFSEVRLVISFLPVVGTLFPLRSREESPFDRPDDPRPL